jgi:hypothetical protein
MSPATRTLLQIAAATIIGTSAATAAQAGMPSPHLVITELGKRRLEEISFFLVGFLALTAIVRWLWNGLRKDIPALPRLSYRGALCLMLLWGLALTVVLSLVSGARELMTPAAWEPNGITHRLTGANATTPVDEIAARRQRLLDLKTTLWDFAAKHDGHFPAQLAELPADRQVADVGSGLTYFLSPNLTITSPQSVLISEPDINQLRLLLMTDGSIVEVHQSRENGP